MGAWIETLRRVKAAVCNGVAPYVGAWIETLFQRQQIVAAMGRTLRGCVD